MITLIFVAVAFGATGVIHSVGAFVPLDVAAETWVCNGTSDVIRAVWVCDSDIDCPNGMDEHTSTCNKDTCNDYEFDCGGGYCIVARWVCDDDEDCLNGADERNCSTEVDGGDCSSGDWKCDDGTCIDVSWKCDGDFDCDDNSDESKATCEDEISCTDNYMSCYSPAMCMPSFWICDGNTDCNDGSDEENCTDVVTEPPEGFPLNCSDLHFSCSVGGIVTCLELDKQCNGENDCDDDSDESDECHEPCIPFISSSQESSYSCQHICRKSPRGPVCSCREGFRLSDDKKNCDDINECQAMLDASGKNISCDHFCTNTNGSYKCGCAPGYALRENNYSCKAEGHARPILHIALYESIREKTLTVFRPGFNVTGEYKEADGVEPIPGAKIVGGDYLWKESRLVWLEDSEKSSLIRSKAANQSVELLLNISKAVGTIKSIGIDWVGRNVYFVYSASLDQGNTENSKPGKVGLVPLKSSKSGAVHGIAENFENLTDIITISHKGMVVISEYAYYGRIIRISMDGYQSWVYHRGISWPNSLAYDIPTDTLFWSQLSPDRSDADGIHSMKLDGSNKKMVISSSVPYMRRPVSVSVFESRLFWYDIERKEILAVDSRDGRNHVVIQKVHQLHQNGTLNASVPNIVRHPVMQPDIAGNECENSSCSHACVMVSGDTSEPQSAVKLVAECICPEGRDYFRFSSMCKEQKQVPFLVTKEGGVIRLLYTDGRSVVKRLSENHSALSIVYDNARSRIYFSGSSSGIFYVDMTQENLRSMPISSSAKPTRYLTLDPVSGNIYWIDEENCAIKTASPRPVQKTMAGKNVSYFPEMTIFKDPTKCPQGLAFDTNRNRLYFIDLSPFGPALYSIGFDAKNLTRVQSVSPSTRIVHMTYDPYEDLVVAIAEGRFAVLLFSLKIAKKEFKVYRPPSLNVTAVAVSPDLIYTYSAINDTIWSQRKQKTGSDAVTEVTANASVVSSHTTEEAYPGGGFAYVNPDLFTKNDSNPCNTNGSSPCSQFCFVSSQSEGGYLCGCQDGLQLADDGVSCLANQCPADEFYCNANTISADQLLHRLLPKDSFPECISREEVCDRRTLDCYDGSDESTAVCDCNEPVFKPCVPKGGSPDGIYQCVKANFFCDGDIDCLNQADEQDCPCDLDFNFLCPEPPGILALCIPLEWVNDGEEDCISGGDESPRANITCFDGDFPCSNGVECVDSEFVCDDFEDCLDGSDEVNCVTTPAPTTAPVTVSMPATGNTSASVSTPATGNASTTGIPVTTAFSPTTEVTTEATTTTAETTTKAPCSIHDYQCDTGDCIRRTWVCDGMDDCSDGSDEGGLCPVSCKTHPDTIQRCLDVCHNTPKGPTCPCPPGYAFDSVRAFCNDIDECATGENDCDQTCDNTDGSYKCGCVEGYIRVKDSDACKAEGTLPFFLVSTQKDLRLFTARSQLHYELVHMKSGIDTSQINPGAITVKGESYVYWTDRRSKSLFVTNVWTAETRLLAKHIPDIKQMAWDWIGEKLYWINGNTIEMVSQDGQYSHQIVNSTDTVNSMALQPLKTLLFYSTVTGSASGKITQCQGNGQFCSTYAENKQDFYRSLTIDIVADTLYWVLHHGNRIESSNLVKYSSTAKKGFDIASGKAVTGLLVFEQYVSWIETDVTGRNVDESGQVSLGPGEESDRLSVVYSLNKKTLDVESRKAVRDYLEASYHLQVMQKMAQPKQASNFCKLPLFCEYFCFNELVGSCVCPTKKLHSVIQPSTPERTHNCDDLPVCADPILPEGAKGTIQSVDGRQGGLAKILCDGDSTVQSAVCGADGKWFPDTPTCSGALPECPRPDSAYLSVSVIGSDESGVESSQKQFKQGAQVVLSCSQGRGIMLAGKAVDDLRLTCGTEGKWDPPVTECVDLGTTTALPIIDTSSVTTAAPSAAKTKSGNGIIIAIVVVVVLILLLVVGLVICWRYRSFSTSLFHRDSQRSHKLITPMASEPELMGVDNPAFAVSYRPNEEHGDGGVSVMAGTTSSAM